MLLFRTHPEFFKLWAGQAISAFGSRITLVAMPLVAVVLLQASPVQMGVLSALTVLPHLLFGLVAGVWVDRVSRRRLLILTDLGRAFVLGTIPFLGIAGMLRIEALYAIAFLAGLMTLVFDTAATSLVPSLVGRANLLRANGAWVLNTTVASTAGPPVAGVLVQLLTAPVAIAFDAASFVVSAACSFLIKVDGTPGETNREPVRWWPEISEGLRLLFAHAILSPITISAMVGAMSGAMQSALIVLYLVRDLSFTPSLVGLALAATGVASVFGALAAPRISQSLGPGPSYLLGGFLTAVAGLVLAAADAVPIVMLGQALAGVGPPLFSVPQTTLRQTLVPDSVLGRVNATWRFLVFGIQPVGAVIGGAVGASLGLRAALVIGSLGILIGVAWAFRSPVRSLRQLPAHAL